VALCLWTSLLSAFQNEICLSVFYLVMHYTTVFFSNRLSHFRGQAAVKNFIEM
jgi:hypothetical protein